VLISIQVSPLLYYDDTPENKNIFFYKSILVFDIIEMENDERDDLLKMDEGQMTDVAKFCNRYPNIEMNHEVVDPEDAQTGSPTIVNVTLEREDELQGNVIGKFFYCVLMNIILILAPFYPGKRDEGWWLVIGEHKTNSLLAIKHVSLQQKKKIALELVPQKVSLEFFGHIDTTKF